MRIASRVLSLFPTKVWCFQVEDQNTREDLLEFIDVERAQDPKGTSATNQMGWHSRYDLFNTPQVKSFIVSTLLPCTKKVVAEMGGRDLQVNLSALWANVNGPGGYNRYHSHAGSFLTGVVYLKVPDHSGDLIFFDPRGQISCLLPRGHLKLPVPSKERYLHEDRTYEIRLTPNDGLLILFPGWLGHLVEPNSSPTDRISCAFDIFVQVKTCEGSSLPLFSV